MAKENMSDEEYLDSLLEKLSQNTEEDDFKIEDVHEMSEEEMEASADESLNRLLQQGAANAAFDADISLDDLIEKERAMSIDDAEAEEHDAGEMSLDGLGSFGGPVGVEESEETKGRDISDDELIDSLSSIVEEIHGGLDEAIEKEGKGKKPKKAKKNSGKKKKAGGFSKKLKDVFFKVETVDLAEEEQRENQKRQQKEEKKKAEAEQKAQDKAKKLEDKKTEAAKKQEEAQKKKQEKEKKQQERKAKKAAQAAELGTEERVQVKPAFVAFVATLVAVMAIAVVLLSNSYAYQNNLKAAQQSLAFKNYEDAYQTLAGMQIKKEEQEFYQKIVLLVRLDRQYDAYVNFKNTGMDKEALHALMQGMTIYYSEMEEAKVLGIETEMDELRDTILYSLSNDYGLNEEKVQQISELSDTNEYTREIEFYSAGRIQ